MRYWNIALALLVSLFGVAHAGVLTFNKTVEITSLASELKAATGYSFLQECPTCTIQGHISARAGYVEVHVYETGDGVYKTTATFDSALQTAITDTVNSHTP